MSWRVEDGLLQIVYSSASRVCMPDEVLADQIVWSWLDDACGTDFSEKALSDGVIAKFKAMDIPISLLDHPPGEVDVNSIYYIEWPSNTAKLLFNDSWMKIGEVEKLVPDRRYVAILEIYLTIAQAIDHVQEDNDLTSTRMVQKELNSAVQKYQVFYGIN